LINHFANFGKVHHHRNERFDSTAVTSHDFVVDIHYHSYWDIKFGLQYLPDSYHIATAYMYELPSMLIYVWLWLNRKKM
jgi:hypothetical protein